MELYDVMRTTFSAREFTPEPVPEALVTRILDQPASRPAAAIARAGVSSWCATPPPARHSPRWRRPRPSAMPPRSSSARAPGTPSCRPRRTTATIERTPAPARLTEPFEAPVVLVVCVDLSVVASMDQFLPRVGVISGASIYPFAWNILLAARHEGCAGTITTLPVAQEPKIQALLGIPAHVAVAAVMPIGRPATRLTRLNRKPVASSRCSSAGAARHRRVIRRL